VVTVGLDWLPESDLKTKLDAMADKGLVLDSEIGGETKYCLPPTLVGLFEFSMIRVIVPENTIARTLMMSVENSTLQHLLIDRHASMGSAAIAAFIGAILNLPPAKQLPAPKSIKSRFVQFLASKA
jgi:hypothetical protein